MSTANVAQEIQRFLASDVPEVLCIRGRWGTGKTFAWQRYMKDAAESGKLTKQHYAYVSLFGLNSLEDLRFAIFENTVPSQNAVTGPDAQTLIDQIKRVFGLRRKARKFAESLLSTFGYGAVAGALARSAFVLVRNRLICIDDLERAGDGLKPRDVLGLISLLKEQRNCQVVILLNEDALNGENKADFGRMLEKVVDVSLTFEPTPAEAAAIAVDDTSPVAGRVREATSRLAITNIRVIKKIERLAVKLVEILEPYCSEVLDQAVVAVAIGGWVAYEPDEAPSKDAVLNYQAFERYLDEHMEKNPRAAEPWVQRLDAISFASCDDFDRVVIEGAQVGYFKRDELTFFAQELHKQAMQFRSATTFKAACTPP